MTKQLKTTTLIRMAPAILHIIFMTFSFADGLIDDAVLSTLILIILTPFVLVVHGVIARVGTGLVYVPKGPRRNLIYCGLYAFYCVFAWALVNIRPVSAHAVFGNASATDLWGSATFILISSLFFVLTEGVHEEIEVRAYNTRKNEG